MYECWYSKIAKLIILNECTDYSTLQQQQEEEEEAPPRSVSDSHSARRPPFPYPQLADNIYTATIFSASASRCPTGSTMQPSMPLCLGNCAVPRCFVLRYVAPSYERDMARCRAVNVLYQIPTISGVSRWGARQWDSVVKVTMLPQCCSFDVVCSVWTTESQSPTRMDSATLINFVPVHGINVRPGTLSHYPNHINALMGNCHGREHKHYTICINTAHNMPVKHTRHKRDKMYLQ